MSLTKFTEYLTAGTIAVTAGSQTVILTGYTWVDLQLGDQIEAQGRVAGILSLDTDTQLTLMLPWTGTTAAGIPYVAWKVSKSRYDPSLTQASLREFTEKLHDSGIVYNVAPGEVPDNAIGEDGQWAIRFDASGLAMWFKVDGIWEMQSGGAGATAEETRSAIYAAPFDALAYNGMQVNGSMEVSQENGNSVVSVSNSLKYILDGWSIWSSGTTLAIGGVKSAGAPAGHIASFQAAPTTAVSSPAANDFCVMYQWIEGLRMARLAFGTASAQPITIGFWIAATRTGLFSGAVLNYALNRSCVFSFTINAANTWEYKAVTVPGDTAGTWKKDNTAALMVAFAVMAGSAKTSAAGAWVPGAFLGATGTTNCVASLSDTMSVTGVIVLPGIELPSTSRAPYIMRPYDQELQTCQRYWWSGVGGELPTAAPRFGTDTYRFVAGTFTSTMRASPTMTVRGLINYAGDYAASAGSNVHGWTANIDTGSPNYTFTIQTLIADARL